MPTKIGNGPRVRRTLPIALRPLAANVEHWLDPQLNAYLQGPNEHRATTRHLLQPGDTITYLPHTITVRLDRPTSPKITCALSLVTDQLEPTRPTITDDPRPIRLHHHHIMINIDCRRNPSGRLRLRTPRGATPLILPLPSTHDRV